MRFSSLSCVIILLAISSHGFGQCVVKKTTNACPSKWKGFGEMCYRFVSPPRLTRAKAGEFCKEEYATLLRIDSLVQLNDIRRWLEANSVNKSLEWYTSGMINPSKFGDFMWQGQPTKYQAFNGDLVNNDALWKLTKPKAEQETTWDNRRYVTLKTDGNSYGFNLVDDATERPFICMVKKTETVAIANTERDEKFGVADLRNIPLAPCFLEQPQSQIYFSKTFDSTTNKKISPGQYSVQFSCRALANPRPTYVWYIVDSAATPMRRTVVDPLNSIYGGRYSITEGVFIINFPDSSIDPSGLKRIQCLAQNKYGSILSNQATLTFGSISDFSRSVRSPTTAMNRQTATLSCSPPETLKPRSDIIYNFHQKISSTMVPIVPETRPYVFISQGGALYFSAVTEVDDGSYVCTVTMRSDRVGTNVQSPAIRLIVSLSMPESQEVAIQTDFPKMYPQNAYRGDDIRLECFAIGRPAPFKYSWKKHGGAISNRAELKNLNRVLLIRNAQMEDNGNYTCTVYQGAGDGRVGGTKKKNVTVSLSARPFFITLLKPQFKDINTDAKFVCEGSGQPEVEFEWFRGTTPLKNGGRYAITTIKGRMTELVIKKVVKSDAFTYTCQIRNLHGVSYSSAWLKVLSFKPNFDKYPLENMEGMVEQVLTFKCLAEGSPDPTKTWFKGSNLLTPGNVIVDATTGEKKCESNYCVYKNGNLMIPKLDKTYMGNYSCNAENSLGSARSSGFLNVVNKPAFTLQPENREIRLNTTVDIPCLAESETHVDINYAWYFENQLLKFDRLDLDARRYDTAQLLRPYGRNFGSLRIENVQFDNEGRYKCVVSTPIGDLEKIAWIRVAGPPGPCAGVVARTDNASNTVTLRWVKGTAHHSPILSYVLEVKRSDAVDVWHNVSVVSEPKPKPEEDFREGQLTNLAANAQYTARVRAINELGVGEPSPASDVFTTPAKPPFMIPTNVTGGGGKVTTLVVRWNPIPPTFYNGKNFEYIVSYKKPQNKKWIPVNVKPSALKTINEKKQLEYTFTLPGDTPDYTLFDIRVGSKNEMGEGPFSATKKAYSAEIVPKSTPKDVVASSFNSTALQVRWQRPSPDRAEGVIRGYRIIYWPKRRPCKEGTKDKVIFGIRQTVFGNVDTGIIIGLQPDQYYCITVQVFNNAGDGSESSATEQTTFKRAPSNFPTMLKLHPTGRTGELRVSWIGLSTLPQEESLDGYVIRLWVTGSPTNKYRNFDYGLKTEGYIEGLVNNQRYDIRVYGYSRGGVGTMSSPMIQFMMQSKDECIPGRYPGLEVEYWFLCSNSKRLTESLAILMVSVLTVVLNGFGL